MIDWWLIFAACQPVLDYFRPKGLGIAYIVFLYLHYVVVSKEFFFFLFLAHARINCEYVLFDQVTRTITPSQSEPGSNGNEGLLHTTQI